MSEREDLAKVTSTVECPHKAYEKQRAVHVLNNLSNALGEFHASTKSMESEKTILAKRIAPNLSVFLEKLQEIIDYLESYEDDSPSGDLAEINDRIVDSGKLVLDTLKELQLPPVKPRRVQLTDAGPGVGVSTI